MGTWEEAATKAAKAWVKGNPRLDWREFVGVAWEGVSARAASRARRGLPPMDSRQLYLAAYSAIVDDLRRGEGGFASTRSRPAPLVRQTDADPLGLLDRADRAAFVVVPAPVGRVKRRWSQAEVKALRSALRLRATAAEVAAGLGRTVPGVWYKARVVGVGNGPGRPANAAQRSELSAHLATGLSVCQAAVRMGLSREAAQFKVRLMVRDGLLVRTGGATRACRYVPKAFGG